MSGRQRAFAWPYPRHRHFQAAMRRAAEAWFAERGLAVRSNMPYILARPEDWPHNMIRPEVADYIEHVRAKRSACGEGFALHKYLHHGLSSQALLFNLVGTLILGDYVGPLVSALVARRVLVPEGWLRVEFEVEDRQVFHEDTGQPTSIDLVLRDQVEGHPTIHVESKFTETEFGSCSIFRGGDCDGRNPAGDLSRCYLHYIGRRYWELLGEYGFLDGPLGQERTCLLANHYQFFRLLLFALVKGGTMVLLHDARNPAFICDGPGGRRGLVPVLEQFIPDDIRPRFVTLTVQEVVAKIRASGRHPWIGEFETKYGMQEGEPAESP